MRIMALFSAVIVSTVLVGCSTTSDFKSPPPIGRAPPAQTLFNTVNCFSEGDCTVKIEVIGECQFKVPDLVVLSGMAGRRHAVVWRILSPDYVFSTASGTSALNPKGSGSFFGTPVVLGPIMAVEVTVTTPHLSHEYGLNIVKRSGPACPQVDPYMIE